MSFALKFLVRSGLQSFRGLGAVRWWNRAGIRILGYHEFPAADRPLLEWQCTWIRKHFEPVSLKAIAESLEAGVVRHSGFRTAWTFEAGLNYGPGLRHLFH